MACLWAILCLGLDDPHYPRPLNEVRAMVQLLSPPKNGDVQEQFLARMRQYRFLCGVPYEALSADAGYADLAYHGAFICSRLDQLTHTPSRPPGVTDEQYEKGRKGAGQSNLFAGQVDPVGCVDGWMEDSDPSNIDRVGHRRWILNPSMGRSAFGHHGKYAAMYAFDRSNSDVPDWDVVAYPARGYMPVNFFGGRHAWSVSLNPGKFGKPDAAHVKVAISPLVAGKPGAPLPLDYFKVDTQAFGSGPCVIFRPAKFTPAHDAVFQVDLKGLVDVAGVEVPLSYRVHFVAPGKASGAEASAVYTKWFAARTASIAEISEPLDQLEALVALLENELAPQVEGATLSAARKRVAELLKEPGLKREHDAAQRYKQVQAAERKAGTSKSQLTQAALAYRDIATSCKDTRAGKRAAADFERLKSKLD